MGVSSTCLFLFFSILDDMMIKIDGNYRYKSNCTEKETLSDQRRLLVELRRVPCVDGAQHARESSKFHPFTFVRDATQINKLKDEFSRISKATRALYQTR